MNCSILYEDEAYIVCHKPAGVATQSANLRVRDLMNELTAHVSRGLPRGQQAKLHLINRLDQPVEGLVLVAKTDIAAAELNRQLQNGTMHKTYYAIVENHPDLQENGGLSHLVDYMIHDKKNNLALIAKESDADAKQAELNFCCVRKRDNLALLQIELLTGRHHQIRLQMSHAGHPLIGDTKYGTEDSRKISEAMQCRQVALCAYKLTFKHPKTKKEVCYEIVPKSEIFHILND